MSCDVMCRADVLWVLYAVCGCVLCMCALNVCSIVLFLQAKKNSENEKV